MNVGSEHSAFRAFSKKSLSCIHEWAPQLWEADTQKLARLVRNYGIETVNAATMARGVHRANSCGTTRAPAQLADVVVRYCGVRNDRPARVEGSDHRL